MWSSFYNLKCLFNIRKKKKSITFTVLLRCIDTKYNEQLGLKNARSRVCFENKDKKHRDGKVEKKFSHLLTPIPTKHFYVYYFRFVCICRLVVVVLHSEGKNVRIL